MKNLLIIAVLILGAITYPPVHAKTTYPPVKAKTTYPPIKSETYPPNYTF